LVAPGVRPAALWALRNVTMTPGERQSIKATLDLGRAHKFNDPVRRALRGAEAIIPTGRLMPSAIRPS
jgi:hypothetical protein